MERRLLDFDPVTKRTTYLHMASDASEYGIETVHDDSDIVEANNALYAQTDERARWGDLARVGSIPTWLYFQLQREGAIDAEGNVQDDKPLLKWLQDRDHLKFRTRPGRLI
jgi:hypothetical protein